MSARPAMTLVFLTAVLGMSACHKQTPPVMAPAPAPSPATQAAPQQAPPSRPPVLENSGSTPRDAGAANAVITEMIHFNYDQAEIQAGDGPILDRKAALLKAHPNVRIRITGYCDERGSDEYNIALGMRRAAAARQYLTLRGIDASRIDVASLGRERPLDTSETEAGWARNRRDEFVPISGSLAMMETSH